MKRFFKWGLVLFCFLIFIAIFALTIHFYLERNDSQNRLAFIKSIPIPQNTEMMGEFSTSYPDATPSVGYNFLSSDEKETVYMFYKNLIDDDGWNIILDKHDSKWESVPYHIGVKPKEENFTIQILIDKKITSNSRDKVSIVIFSDL